jgi:hypothetical protein
MPILPDTFCVFVLTHGRPDNVATVKTLKQRGYTGRLYLVVDNEDKTVNRYRENFGAEKVIVFDKLAEANACDEGNNFDERRTITMARNACFGIAEQLGVTHFMELDDDYRSFELRFLNKDGTKLLVKQVADADKAIWIWLEFFEKSGATSLAFAQGGDFIGGINSGYVVRGMPLIRKAMNSFICSTSRPFRFAGAMNEDVNTYTTLGSRGTLLLTVPLIAFVQGATQSQAGGITAMYERFGTYCKAFTTVMMMPSAVKVALIPGKHRRLHHLIDWPRCVPCIVPERYRKPGLIMY